MHKAHIFMFSLALALSGCASNSISPHLFSEIQYGETRSEVLSRLGKPGIPIFRFSSNQKNYFTETFSPGETQQSYVLLYEDDRLIVVITAEVGRRIWGQVFGQFDASLPVSEKFEDILNLIRAERLDLRSTNFNALNREAQKERQKIRNYDVTTGLVYLPFGLFAAVATAPVLVPAMLMDNTESEIEKREADIIAGADHIPLGASSALVNDLLGEPVAEFNDGKEKILVFDPSTKKLFLRSKISIGLNNDTVVWIGYYYDARAILVPYLHRKPYNPPKTH
jgi:hypothetical protein